MRLFMCTSNLVQLFGIIDLAALITITCTLITGPLILGHVPLTILAGALYTFLWWNKAYFTSRVTGSAFPAVFGLDWQGEFNINVLWYVFSTLILILLCFVTFYTLQAPPAEFAIAAASTLACGRATIQALVMGHALAAVYERQNR